MGKECKIGTGKGNPCPIQDWNAQNRPIPLTLPVSMQTLNVPELIELGMVISTILYDVMLAESKLMFP